MDESIRGDQLGIDNPGLGTTPYLQELDGRVLNLGIACSAGNNSGISNIIVQSGLGLGQVPDLEQLALKRPSIFQYARQANRKTCFINSQKAKFDNHMGLYDYRDIDRFIHIGEAFPELPKWMHDQAAAQCIVDFLDTPDQTFTYVVKYGAHFPYCKMYPHDGGEPALLRVVPESDFSGEENPEDEFSDYRNAVRWSVDEFFRKLIPGLEGKDYLLFYISDHGQSLDSHRGLLNPTPHNTPEHPPSEQAVTPMFMIASRPDGTALNPELVSRMLANRDRLSHFQVFPTLLCFLGYDRKEINECYGATVFDQVPEERYFVSGDLFGRDKCEKNLFRKDGPG